MEAGENPLGPAGNRRGAFLPLIALNASLAPPGEGEGDGRRRGRARGEMGSDIGGTNEGRKGAGMTAG